MPPLAGLQTLSARPPVPEDWPRDIVVATDGRMPSESAIVAASRLANAATFGVISVISVGHSTDRDQGHTLDPLSIDDRRQLIERQVHRLLGDAPDVWVEIRTGYPPAVLASFAQLHGVAMLIVGIGRPAVLDRLRGDESTLRLARMTQTPLFAVANGCAVPPRRIVVAMDFSRASMRAAKWVLAVAAPDGDISLVNVRSPAERATPYGSLRRLAEHLQSDFSGHVRPVELHGDPATELLAYASQERADLISVGSRGARGVSPGSLGAVATRVVRCAGCSLILAPGE
ncbi:MAG: universal stress protein [Gemmatimonadales bacterium]